MYRKKLLRFTAGLSSWSVVAPIYVEHALTFQFRFELTGRGTRQLEARSLL